MRTFDSVTTSLYPWDILGDPGAASLIAEAGVDRITLPGLYHAVRADSPRHPSHRVIETPASALYTNYDTGFWASRPIAPHAGSPWIGEVDAFAAARDALRAEGLAVDAWTVLMHADGSTGPGVDAARFRNAIGDSYPWALCPRAPGVLDYAFDLLRTVAAEGADGIMLEACGVYGFDHLSSHDKTGSAGFTDTDVVLLSICFCPACRADLRSAGLDDDEAAAAVLRALGTTRRDLDPVTGVREALGDLADAIATVRAQTNRWFQEAVLGEARRLAFDRISIQASADVWSTGFSASVRHPETDVDVAIVNCGGVEGDVKERLSTLGGILDRDATRLGAFAPIPASTTRDELGDRWRFLADAGADELHLYHLGLASTPTLTEVTAALHEL